MRTDPRRRRAVDPNGRPRDPTSWLCILYRIECANSNTIALNTSLGQEMPNVMRTHIDTEYDNQTGGLTRERYLTSQITPPIASAWKPHRWAKRRSSRAARKTPTEQIPNFGHWATKHPGGRCGERKIANTPNGSSGERHSRSSLERGMERSAHVPRKTSGRRKRRANQSTSKRLPANVRVSDSHTTKLTPDNLHLATARVHLPRYLPQSQP